MSAASDAQCSRGKRLGLAVAGYIILKQIVNGIVGSFSGMNLFILFWGVIAGICFYKGVKKSNLFFAVLMMLIACAYFPQNILNFRLLYIFEGALDILAAVMLAFHPDIRAHCKCL